jgi:hypothetical protein
VLEVVLEECTSPSPLPKVQKQKQKPSRAKTARGTKTALVDERHTIFKAAIQRYWESKNPGLELPWDGREGKALGMFLSAAPNVTIEQFTGFLRNRFKSDVNHGERASQWIAWVTSYAAGPMDRFGKTITVNSVGGKKNGRGNEILEALAESLREDQDGPRADGHVSWGETGREDALSLCAATLEGKA